MRGYDAVCKPGEGVVTLRRFFAHDVERRAGKSAVGQGFREVCFIHYRAARGVDEIRAPLHFRDEGGAYKPACFVGERAVERDEIRFAKKRFTVGVFDAVGNSRNSRAAVGKHPHPEGAAELSEPLSDGAAAVNPDGFSGKLHAGYLLIRDAGDSRPAAVADDFAEAAQVVCEGEEEGEGELGYRVGRITRRVADLNSPFAAGADVDHIVPGAEGGHELYAFAGIEQSRGDLHAVCQDYVGSGKPFCDKLRRGAVVHGIFSEA